MAKARSSDTPISSRSSETPIEATSSVEQGRTYVGVRTRVPVPSSSAEGTSPAEERPKKVAILVCHGMGQQVPFETVDLVARGLLDAEQFRREHGGGGPATGAPKIETEIVKLRLRDGTTERLPRAKLTVTAADHRPREVHMYEAYWAPLMEGKISALQVLEFLMRAAWNGLGIGVRGRTWWRFMFKERHKLPVDRWVVLQFALALIVFLPPMLLNVLIPFIAIAFLVRGFLRAADSAATGVAAGWPSEGLLGDLTIDLMLFVVCGGLVLLGALVIPGRLRRGVSYLNPPGTAEGWWRLCWALIVVGAIGSSILGWLVIPPQLWRHSSGPLWGGAAASGMWWPLPPPWAWPGFGWSALLAGLISALIWIVAFGLCFYVRRLSVQYIGDVAAYVDAYTLDKTWSIREAIKAECWKVAWAMYAAIDARGRPTYSRVVVVGHSLGSVVAYDTLNALINDDLTQERLGDPTLGVVERTEMLLTFGSPLDKTAFVFTTQKPSTAEVREALAAARQLLIVDYALRPHHWVNIWSPSDVISGDLNFYDPPAGWAEAVGKPPEVAEQQQLANRVRNYQDEDARSPLSGHNDYWVHHELVDTLYGAVIGEYPYRCPHSECADRAARGRHGRQGLVAPAGGP
ncbi:MAG: hypothetical protein H0V51_21640 [Chloroflexi bacterium]|nr:hypothetical protein [Chloroflexota bacterium]